MYKPPPPPWPTVVGHTQSHADAALPPPEGHEPGLGDLPHHGGDVVLVGVAGVAWGGRLGVPTSAGFTLKKT